MLLAGLLCTLACTSSSARQTSPPVAGPPPSRGWDDFPVFVWREKHAGKPLPEDLAGPFGGVILMREEDSSWARARGLAYLVWNVAGRDALHLDADEAWNARVERWIETRDEQLLVREPCLNDPQTLARLRSTLEATIARHGAHPGLGFVLGDEVSLTPNGDPFDLCRCQHCEARWRAHAKELELPARAPLTDEVRLLLLEDDFSSLGAWLARRRFDRREILELLDRLLLHATPPTGRDHYRLPGVRGSVLGLLGCVGQTPFGGVALNELATRLDFIECYPVRDARELVETVPDLRRHGLRASSGPDPRPRSLATLFVEGECPAGLAWLAWEQWVRGGDGLVLWSDAQLEELPAAQRERLARAVREIRSVQERSQFDGPSPRPFAIALLHDDDSDAVGFLKDALLDGKTWPRRRTSLQGEHGTRDKKVRAWLRLSEDCGYRPGSLPLEHLCPDCTREYPVLIAPELLVVGEAEISALGRHVQQGGLLIVDGRLGWVDRRGRPHPEDVLGRLRSLAPDRVLEAPRFVESYVAERWDAATRDRARAFVEGLMARVDRSPGPERLGPGLDGETVSLPWLAGRMRHGDTSTFAFLPNCPTREERSVHLQDIVLRSLEAPDGFDLEWLHPTDGRILPAGDAAVFRLKERAGPAR